MKILFFDGHCNLCNGLVNWMIRRSDTLQFAPLQGSTAREKLPAEWIRDLDTAVYFREGKLYRESSAVLWAVGDFGGLWPLALALLVLPAFLRNAVYATVAKNRYRIFGRNDTCRVPTSAERARFLP